MDFTHIDGEGRAMMVDVSGKPKVLRVARACGKIYVSPETIRKIRDNQVKKGDVISVANVAGIMAAKKTSDLIPLCHNIEIDQITLTFTLLDNAVEIESRAVCTDKTGIEMEALTAVSVAALTIYDMCKAVDRDMRITDIRLIEKTKQPAGKDLQES